MSWNNALEKKRFDRKEKELMKQYRAAGMSEESIRELYELDWKIYKSDRRFYEHTESLEGLVDKYYEGQQGACLKNNMEVLTVSLEPDRDRPFWWIDEMEDEKMIAAINLLTDHEKMLIHLIVFEGRTQNDVAELFGLTPGAITYQLQNAYAKIAEAIGRPLNMA